MKGGKFFSERTPVHLAGATFDGSFCKMRGIYTGMMMEFNIGLRRQNCVIRIHAGARTSGWRITRW